MIIAPTQVERWAVQLPFNPHSSDQMLALLKARGLPIKFDRKSRKPTTSEEALDQICRERSLPKTDPLRKAIRCRKYKKGIGYLYDTYLGADGRIHPEYTQLPDTGRLSARAPNIQNQPQGRDEDPDLRDISQALSRAIRASIIPSPGCTLIEVDWRGLQALLVAYFANDPDYGRICEIDVHSYLAAMKVGKPADLAWDDERLTKYLKEIKKTYPVERHLCKTGNHADAFDIKIPHLSEVLGSVEMAVEFKRLRATAFPKIKKWQTETRLRAHFDGRLQTPFGNLRYFWNVFEMGRDGKMGLGAEAWEALAFLPQGTEAGMLKEVLLALRSLAGYGRRYWLLAPIHDSLFLEAQDDAVEECIKDVQGLMEQSWPQMGGLKVKTDYKISKTNWADMGE